MAKPKLKVLLIESDPGARRAVEYYLQSFNRNDLLIESALGAEDFLNKPTGDWDIILFHQGDEPKKELLNRIKLRSGAIPVLEIGPGSNDLITGIETTLDELLPRIDVAASSLLRSVTHLLERRQLERRVESLEQALTQSSHVDSLTGLWNHSYSMERIAEEFMSWQRYRYPLTICLADIAGFSKLNEIYGFEVADDVLRLSGRIIRETKRNTDFAGRFGSDAFCVVFPKTPTASSLVGVERLRDAIQKTLFTGKFSENFTVDMCFGVAQLAEEDKQPSDLINRTRLALKKAKGIGNGRIEIAYSSTMPTGPRVLVVDDHTSILDLCCDVFQEKGYITTAARSAREAIRAMKDSEYDLFVVDLRLPDMEGRDFIKNYCISAERRVPVIVVTGEAETNLNELRGLGVMNLLRKPFSPDELFSLAQSLIHESSSTDGSQAA